jgi:fructokinase
MSHTLLCTGEVLWDVLPMGRFLGGAPLNVAAHAARFGARAQLFSSVGNDEPGRAALERMRALGVDTRLVAVDPRLPTGQALATLDASGSASYAFTTPCAWDGLAASAEVLGAAHAADVVIHGTLAKRATASRTALCGVVAAARAHVYDPNLRTPHDDADVALAGLNGAYLVKLNAEEAARFSQWLHVPDHHPALAQALRERYGVQRLCITLGGAGAWFGAEGLSFSAAGPQVQVADTVGAGDAFLAMLTVSLLQGVLPVAALSRALRLGALVASRPGAVPDYAATEVEA